jgi:plastocyanin
MEGQNTTLGGKKKNSFLPLVGIALAILVILGGLWLLNSKNRSMKQNSVNNPATSALPKEVTVRLTKDGFEPSTVTIQPGGAVRWVNESGNEATVNSNDHPTHQLYKELNLGTFSKGSTLVHIFDKPGTYGYHDHFHPTKTGTVTVQ